MAVYFQNTLLASGDFIRITRKYSSAQSLSRARKRGTAQIVAIGRMRFAHTTPEQVAALHAIGSWQNLQVITEVPGGLSSLNSISKKIGVGEAQMISWAVFNRIDVYWIGGTFFGNQQLLKAIADGEKQRMNSFTMQTKKQLEQMYRKQSAHILKQP